MSMKCTTRNMMSVSLQVTCTLSYPPLTALYYMNGVSAWCQPLRGFLKVPIFSFLADLAHVASEKAPPVTSSYRIGRSVLFFVMISDKNWAKWALLESKANNWLQTCVSGTCCPPTNLRFDIFLPTHFDWVTAFIESTVL